MSVDLGTLPRAGSKHNLGAVVSVNSGAVRLFGYTRSQIVGSNVKIIVPPPFRCVSWHFSRTESVCVRLSMLSAFEWPLVSPSVV